MKTHDLFAHSAEAAYYLFVSFFPFMILLVSALSHVGLISVFLEREMTFLPGEVWAFVHDAVIELEEIDSLAAVPFSVITLLWSASRGMTAVTKPLRLIYGNSQKGSFLFARIKGIAFTLGLGLFIVISIVSFGFGERLAAFIGLESTILSSRVGAVFVFALLVIFFNIIYVTIRAERRSPISELGGAVAAASMWVAFSYAYSYYVDSISSTSVIYGSAASVVLLLLWLNFCILFLLVGAELNNILPIKEIKVIKK